MLAAGFLDSLRNASAFFRMLNDGALIRVHNRALSAPAPSGGARYVRCAPRFEAPVGPHDWLNKAIFVGTLAVDNPARPKVVTLRFFKVA